MPLSKHEISNIPGMGLHEQGAAQNFGLGLVTPFNDLTCIVRYICPSWSCADDDILAFLFVISTLSSPFLCNNNISKMITPDDYKIARFRCSEN